MHGKNVHFFKYLKIIEKLFFLIIKDFKTFLQYHLQYLFEYHLLYQLQYHLEQRYTINLILDIIF